MEGVCEKKYHILSEGESPGTVEDRFLLPLDGGFVLIKEIIPIFSKTEGRGRKGR
jgi:hypothetical protein